MEAAEIIKGLRDKTGMTRKAFSDHLGIPVRTVEDWEKGKRTPPEYIPRLIAYQLKYEELQRRLINTPSLQSGKMQPEQQ